MQRISECMDKAHEIGPPAEKQLAVILGTHNIFQYSTSDAELNALVSNEFISRYFRILARELNVEDPKTPSDVYKTTSDFNNTARSDSVQSARENLSATFVNAFVNVAFQSDAFVTHDENNWIFRNKGDGIISASASLGMILLWNIDEGLSQIDKYMYSNNDNVKAGALLALGILCSGVRDECGDPAFAMLPEYLESSNPSILQITASLGLGIAYAGFPRHELTDSIMETIKSNNKRETADVSCLSALSLGMMFCGTGDEEIALSLYKELSAFDFETSKHHMVRFFCLSIALIFLGSKKEPEKLISLISKEKHPLSALLCMLLESFTYTASGNVLKIQMLLHICAENTEAQVDNESEQNENGESTEVKSSNTFENLRKFCAVIGLALITLRDDVGKAMILRTYQHLLQYGNAHVRRAVPLAMALSHVSNPEYSIVDVLSKLTHDLDTSTAMASIFSLGIIGAGTNNSRIAGLLMQLSQFYLKDADAMFVVRLAQGLLHCGKGLVSLSPLQSDGTLLSNKAITGLLVSIFCAFSFESEIIKKYHFLFYSLACAIRPRMLMTVDENMDPVTLNVRVGQGVDVVGQVGIPKRITGFQTHTTPVLLGPGERAEIADDAYEAVDSIMEGVVIVKKI